MILVKIGKGIIVNERLYFKEQQHNISFQQMNNSFQINNNNLRAPLDNLIKATPKIKINGRDKFNLISEKIKTLNEKINSLNTISLKFFSNEYNNENKKKQINEMEKSINGIKELMSSEKNKFNEIILGIENKDYVKKMINNNEEDNKNEILNFIKEKKQYFIEKIN
jgi:Tfp pilus assembly PilM family ATPase